jgi:hypothetical protein
MVSIWFLIFQSFSRVFLSHLDTLFLVKKIEKLRTKYSPSSKLWMTETGSAQCGGEKNNSDTFVDCFWWLDELGILSQTHEVVVRQSLIGGDYGLIDDSTFEPNPDYWASYVFKKLVGKKVYSISKIKDKKLRAYSFSNKDDETKKTLLLLNLSNKPMDVKLISDNFKTYEISSDKLHSKNLYVNSQLMKFQNLEISKLPEPIISKSHILEIKPLTISFVVI